MLGVVGLLVSLASVALGQTSGDSSSHRLRVNAPALRPSQLVYQTTLERDAGTSQLGTRTVTVTGAAYAGAAAWLLVENRSGEGGFGVADSLVVDAAALRPQHWSSTIGSARLAVEFRGDSLFGATSGPPGRRSMVASIPSGTLVSSAMLETVLRLLPLQNPWEDSTAMLSISLGSNMVLPTRISVIGEDRVRVPAGMFDCWVVSVRAEGARGLYWVTKQDPIVVRSALDIPTLGGAQLVSALTRIAR